MPFHIFNLKSFWCKRTLGESGDQSSLLYIECKGFGTNNCLKVLVPARLRRDRLVEMILLLVKLRQNCCVVRPRNDI